MSVPPPGRQADAYRSVDGAPADRPGQPENRYVPRTKLLVLGVALSVWGLAIVLRGLVSSPQGDSAYTSGQRFAIVLGVVMLIVGARQLWLEYRARRDAAV